MRLLARGLSSSFFVALFLGLSLPVRAEASLPQQYLEVYLKINDAEHFEKNQDYKGAFEAYEDCYAKLTKIHDADPRWETALVLHRMDDCKAKFDILRGKDPSLPVFAFAPPNMFLNKPVYPWRANVAATTFWIGESTASAWNEKWLQANGGPDSPLHRNGYTAGEHASSLNPFYVALPFNDLTHPDETRKWLPPGWLQSDGKVASACKDRWVEIKNSTGNTCYAQWEDVGPSHSDDAEYVFGDGRPKDANAGISLSPAAAEYLGMNDQSHVVSWKFVDAENVRPGAWLKLDEQAVMFTALHEQNK